MTQMTDTVPQIKELEESAEREMKPALRQGWKRQCPNCGTGKLFSGYLKVRDDCLVCGEVFSHHRADDAPPYLTILVVGHILAPLMIWFYDSFRLDPLIMIAIFGTAATGLTLFLLPRFKGMVITFQWAKRMGGFGQKSR
jgi:uncharacterized protein (DUF983 family)